MKLYPRHYFTKHVRTQISVRNNDELKQLLAPLLHKMLRDLENRNNPLKRYREEHRLTCRDVADRMGTYTQRYSKIELGQIKPQLKEQDFINNFFGAEALNWVMAQYDKPEVEHGEYISAV